jgi:hypothetical protein
VRLQRVAAGDVLLVGAEVHVAGVGDQVRAIVATRVEAAGDLLRLRVRGRHGEPVQEVTGGVHEVERNVRVIDDLDSGHGLDLLLGTGHAFDDVRAVVVAVIGRQARGVDPLERVLDVLSGDRAVQRRGPHDVVPDGELVGQAVLGDVRLRDQVGLRNGTLLARHVVVVVEAADHQVLEPRPGPTVVLTGRVEVRGVGQALGLRAIGAPLRWRAGRSRCGRCGPAGVVAPARRTEQREDRSDGDPRYPTLPSHVRLLPSSGYGTPTTGSTLRDALPASPFSVDLRSPCINGQTSDPGRRGGRHRRG